MIGYTGRKVSHCFAAGPVQGDRDVGGLIGFGYGETVSSFWDVESSGHAGSAGGKGVSTAEMQSVATYRDGGWADKGWVMEDGLDYPHLVWENPSGSVIPPPEPAPFLNRGDWHDPYQIRTAAEFALISRHASILNKHYRLMNDLDLTGVSIDPIGELRVFEGKFDGNGFVIRGLKIDQAGGDNVGLFSKINYMGEIKNLRLEDVEIRGGRWSGGLLGFNQGGKVSGCSIQGVISGEYQVGGLIGRMSSGVLSESFFQGEISGINEIGGLVGWNVGAIYQSKAEGVVRGE
ncbi:MAG: hypothetical protein GY869_20385, partial [Planctomycetes bacterium]|nr:hypothetical protein [Planctomycetota bacterium]